MGEEVPKPPIAEYFCESRLLKAACNRRKRETIRAIKCKSDLMINQEVDVGRLRQWSNKPIRVKFGGTRAHREVMSVPQPREGKRARIKSEVERVNSYWR